MVRNYRSVSALIDQGYLIKDADDKWSGEVRELPDKLRTNFGIKFPMMK